MQMETQFCVFFYIVIIVVYISGGLYMQNIWYNMMGGNDNAHILQDNNGNNCYVKRTVTSILYTGVL